MLQSHLNNVSVTELPEIQRFQYLVTGNRNIITEHFRRLKVQLTRSKGNRQLILVTSSLPGEGKKFIAVNLATVFSSSNNKTVLVDADLKTTSIYATLLNEKRPEAVPTLVEQKSDIYPLELTVHTVADRFDLVTIREDYRTSFDMLDHDLSQLFALLKENYDTVILNAPCKIYPDALHLEKFTDSTVFVTRHNYTDMTQLAHLKASIDKKEFKDLHVVYNHVSLHQLYTRKIRKKYLVKQQPYL